MAQIVSDKKIDRAVAALLEASTVTEAAEKAKVSRRTLTRWLHEDPEFGRRLRDARREAWAHGSARICKLLCRAVDTIKSSLDGRRIAKGRFLSAKLVIESCQMIQEGDLADRVAELEHRVRERHPYERDLSGLSTEELTERLDNLRQKALQDFSPDQLRERLRQLVAGNGDDTG